MQTEVLAQKQLIDNMTRSSSTWATKDDIAALAAANGVTATDLAAIKADMASVKATLSGINTITATSTPTHSANQPSSSVGPANPNPPAPTAVTCPGGTTVTCPISDPYGFQKNPQNYDLAETFGTIKVPFGQVTFDASKADPWSLTVPNREYVVTNVIGTDENQKPVVYNKFNIKVNGQSYAVPITTATTETIQPKPSFSFNPRLTLGVDTGVDLTKLQGAVTPDVTVQLFSYGTDKKQPDLSILQVGGGYNTVTKVPEIVVNPVQYNIGQHIPLMDNLYVGPTLQYGTDGHFIVGAGIHALF
jgi:hypothetical protein